MIENSAISVVIAEQSVSDVLRRQNEDGWHAVQFWIREVHNPIMWILFERITGEPSFPSID